MPQDRETGAAANEWGRETARRIAAKIDASAPRGSSNECLLDGDRIVIKCARMGTSSVGVTYKMLDRLDGILGAFETENGTYDLFLLTPEEFREHMTPTRSRGASAGRVGLVAKAFFLALGESRGSVRL